MISCSRAAYRPYVVAVCRSLRRTVSDGKANHCRTYAANGLSHVAVMVSEVLEYLRPRPGQTIVDMTFGFGGHSRAILNEVNNDLQLVCLDRDPVAIRAADEFASEVTQNDSRSHITVLKGRFSDLPRLLHERGVEPGTVDGFLLDAGCSSMQLETAERGFSVSADGPLDMRMDTSNGSSMTAADVVNSLYEDDLVGLFTKYGEVKRPQVIASAIVQARGTFGKFSTTRQLADVVAEAVGSRHESDKLGRHAHPATRVFMALRIFVNDELNQLACAMDVARHFLKPATGRMVVLTFHSLEDRIVKRAFGNVSENCSGLDAPSARSDGRYEWVKLTRKPVTPKPVEIEANARARSAKLRAALKSKVAATSG